MVKSERHARILGGLGHMPTLRVAELASELGVSTETIRRDLDELYERGLLERTYGGAVRPFGAEPALARRHEMLARERAAIAACVAELLQPGQVIMLGAGSTTLSVAQSLAQRSCPLTAITNSFGAAREMARNPLIRVLMCPGNVQADEDCVAGAATVEFLQRIHANFAIVGASGLTEEGANEVNDANAAVYAAMLRRAAETIVTADHSKFGRPATMIYGTWQQIGRLATDRAPSGALAAALAAAHVQTLLAPAATPAST